MQRFFRGLFIASSLLIPAFATQAHVAHADSTKPSAAAAIAGAPLVLPSNQSGTITSSDGGVVAATIANRAAASTSITPTYAATTPNVQARISGPKTVGLNASASYTITLRNDGASADGDLFVSVSTASGFELTSRSPNWAGLNCSQGSDRGGARLDCLGGTLAAGETITLEIGTVVTSTGWNVIEVGAGTAGDIQTTPSGARSAGNVKYDSADAIWINQ